MSIRQDVQRLAPGALIEMFEIDATALGGEIEYFHPGTNAGLQPVVWQGNTYTPWAMHVDGFEFTGRGQWPTPRISMSNFAGEMTIRCVAFDDLIGAKLTRRRTFAKYLDGQPGADPNAGYPDDVYSVERKLGETRAAVEWELSTPMDVEGVLIPKRQVLLTCQSQYRSPECSYAGPPVAKADDTPTSDLALDRCSHKLSGCKLRFGPLGPLPFGGCPGAAKR